jgi:hypothetical protein
VAGRDVRVIEEMGNPLGGVIAISREPVLQALAVIGK